MLLSCGHAVEVLHDGLIGCKGLEGRNPTSKQLLVVQELPMSGAAYPPED